ncbi:hypothetical protein MPNT_130022 [Candidatus Methylacidithermus pantelleriae]|uniref:Uncharacterized protein n=1 Tax=Candidatus Methylacidithermus pantelleriae TaxID=2744239 RepID=A0A8J2FNJ5_9BACT|nr:hypothetical protein MPNT_130022 [Candidatus Methylacidithermus pantelleriae]
MFHDGTTGVQKKSFGADPTAGECGSSYAVRVSLGNVFAKKRGLSQAFQGKHLQGNFLTQDNGRKPFSKGGRQGFPVE